MISDWDVFSLTESVISKDVISKPHGDESYNWLESYSVDIDGDGDLEVLVALAIDGGLTRTDTSPIAVLDFESGEIKDIYADTFFAEIDIFSPETILYEDFNGDGHRDIFLTIGGPDDEAQPGPQPGAQNMLFLTANGNPWEFVDATANLPQLTDSAHGSIAGDFNGDGHMDVFINNIGDDDLNSSYLMFGNGDGTFSERFNWDEGNPVFKGFSGATGPYRSAVMDYDGDGDLDLYWGWTTQGSKTGIAFAENDGSGQFTLKFTDDFAVPGSEESVKSGDMGNEWTRSGDLDNDGDLDVIALWSEQVGEQRLALQYLENKGAEGYKDSSDKIEGQEVGGFMGYSTGLPMFELVDLDADGDLDIVHAGWDPRTGWSEYSVFWFLNDGAGNFERIDPELLPYTPHFEVADINGDWIMDVVYRTKENKVIYELGAITESVERAGWATNDRIAGGEKDDVLKGMGGDDQLNGNDGDDLLVGGDGNDTLYGGAGFDTVSFADASVSIFANLSNGTASGQGKDSLHGIENLVGGSAADMLTGDSSDNVLEGGAGDDVINGGGGSDTASYAGTTGAVNVNLSTGMVSGGAGDDTLTSIENITGGSGNDTLTGNGGGNILDGGAGDDILMGGFGSDIYRVDSANDAVIDNGPSTDSDSIISTAAFFWDINSDAETMEVGEGAVTGNGGGVTGTQVVGSMFSNSFIGSDGDDLLYGRGGSDTFRGGNGTDWISLNTQGLSDANSYAGVDGSNTVIVEKRTAGETSYDIVFDFESGKDKLNIADYGYSSIDEVLATGQDDGLGNSFYALGDGLDYLYLVGLTLDDVSSSDFLLA